MYPEVSSWCGLIVLSMDVHALNEGDCMWRYCWLPAAGIGSVGVVVPCHVAAFCVEQNPTYALCCRQMEAMFYLES